MIRNKAQLLISLIFKMDLETMRIIYSFCYDVSSIRRHSLSVRNQTSISKTFCLLLEGE